jgi:hypothetical protein
VVNFANTNDPKKCGGTLPKKEKSFAPRMVIQQADLKNLGLKQLDINETTATNLQTFCTTQVRYESSYEKNLKLEAHKIQCFM